MALSDFQYSLFPGYLGMAVRAGTAAPTTGTWNKADMVINQSPAAGQPWGWVCTVAGTPGTWVPLTQIQGTSGAIAAISAIPATARFATLTSNAAGTYTLAAAAAFGSGLAQFIVTNNNATTFAAASGNQVVGTAAVTAANAPASFYSDGVTSWYRLNG